MNKCFYEMNAKRNMDNVLSHGLYVPSEEDYKKIDYVNSYISGFNYQPNYSFIPSFFALELHKALSDIGAYYDFEAMDEAYEKIDGVEIVARSKYGYSTGFDINGNPKVLEIPANVNRLSSVYIGHELIHLLKDGRRNEFYDLYLYREVLPIFHELLMADNSFMKKTARFLVYEIIHHLREMVSFNKIIIDSHIIEDKELEKYFSLDTDVYSLSYYYAVSLYDVYLEYKEDVLNSIGLVLSGYRTTRDLLNAFDLFDDDDLGQFLHKNNQLIKSCM